MAGSEHMVSASSVQNRWTNQGIRGASINRCTVLQARIYVRLARDNSSCNKLRNEVLGDVRLSSTGIVLNGTYQLPKDGETVVTPVQSRKTLQRKAVDGRQESVSSSNEAASSSCI